MMAAHGLMIAVVALLVLCAGTVGAQSLEEETRRPPGTNSLSNDSERLKGSAPASDSDTQDNDSMDLRGRPADQDGTNSLDDGSLDGGDAPDAD